jgi:hypothetical protein
MASAATLNAPVKKGQRHTFMLDLPPRRGLPRARNGASRRA